MDATTTDVDSIVKELEKEINLWSILLDASIDTDESSYLRGRKLQCEYMLNFIKGEEQEHRAFRKEVFE